MITDVPTATLPARDPRGHKGISRWKCALTHELADLIPDVLGSMRSAVHSVP